MRVIVRGHQLNVTDALKEYAEKKLAKIEKYFDNIQKVQVELDHKPTKAENKRNIAQVTIWASGSIIRAEIASQDMYASIDMVFDKLEAQVRKYKEKLKNKKKQGKVSIGKTFVTELLETESEDQPIIAKTKKLYLSSMTAEEAAIQMKLIGHDFYVYRNTASDEVNVIYIRDEGDFGNLVIS